MARFPFLNVYHLQAYKLRRPNSEERCYPKAHKAED
jgi:hypothetical protein